MLENKPRTLTTVSGSENFDNLDVSNAELKSSSSTFHTSWLSDALGNSGVTGTA